MRKKFFFLGILLGVCLASPAQFYSARTNLIGLATGNINLEGSMTLNRRWSSMAPGGCPSRDPADGRFIYRSSTIPSSLRITASSAT